MCRRFAFSFCLGRLERGGAGSDQQQHAAAFGLLMRSSFRFCISRRAICLFYTKLCSHGKQNSFDAKHDHSTATGKCSLQRYLLPLPLPKHAHMARFVWLCRQSSTSCCDKMAVGTSTCLPAQHIGFVRRKPDEGNKYTAHDALLSHAKTARTHALFKLTVPCDIETVTAYGPPEYFNI